MINLNQTILVDTNWSKAPKSRNQIKKILDTYQINTSHNRQTFSLSTMHHMLQTTLENIYYIYNNKKKKHLRFFIRKI